MKEICNVLMELNDLLSKVTEINPNNPDIQIDLADNIMKKINEENRLQVIDVLISLLDKQKFPASTRAHVIEILSTLPHEKTKEALREALKDPYKLVRSYSVRALGDYKDKSLIVDIEKAGLNDVFFGVMAESIEALKKTCKDILEENNDDKECSRVMDEVIPNIQKKAEKQKNDERFEKRVGREGSDAANVWTKLLKDFNENFEKLKSETKSIDDVKEDKKFKNTFSTTKALVLGL